MFRLVASRALCTTIRRTGAIAGRRATTAAQCVTSRHVAGQAGGVARVAARALHVSAGSEGKVIPYLLTDIGEGNAEAEVLEWFVQPGDTVSMFDPIVNVQSDKAATDITSRYDGKIVKLHYEVGDMALTGTPLVDIEIEGGDEDAGAATDAASADADAGAVADAPAAAAPRAGQAPLRIGGKVLATPAVRRIAREHDLNLAQVPGTGKDGRVLKGDVLAFIKGEVEAIVVEAEPVAAAPPPTPKLSVAAAEDVVVPLTGIQRAMAKAMNAAWSVPHFGYCDEVCMDGLIKLRSQLKPMAEARGVKLSYLPMIIKATSLALQEYPELNAHVNPECTEVVHRASHNIGVAMDTPKGLIVPNVKNVQNLTLFEIAEELTRMQELASAGRLGEAELKDGTFTLSNIGAIGGTYASPVLFVPQVAIGALGKTQTVAKFADDGSVVPSAVMNVSWAADHRTVDGATMARFSNLWRSYLEDPMAMLTSMR